MLPIFHKSYSLILKIFVFCWKRTSRNYGFFMIIRATSQNTFIYYYMSWISRYHYSNSKVIVNSELLCYNYKNINCILLLLSLCLSTPFQPTLFKLENVFINELTIFSSHSLKKFLIVSKTNCNTLLFNYLNVFIVTSVIYLSYFISTLNQFFMFRCSIHCFYQRISLALYFL